MSGQFPYRRRDLAILLGSIAVAWPLGAGARLPMPVTGYLSVGSPKIDNILERLVAFRRGLRENGYVDGQNVAIEYACAEGRNDRVSEQAADLVRATSCERRTRT
jgi:putative ABC transport system substrate-binding protein